MARFDVHAPSRTLTEDYAFVAFNYLPSEGDILGAAEFLLEERKRLRAHMDRTGGKWSGHGNGGCGICGSVNMVYSASFYHEKSNSYLRVGTHACADKLEMGDVAAFKRKVGTALEAGKGVRKAQAILAEAGLSAAWALREADAAKRAAHGEACKAWAERDEEAVMVPDGPYGMKEVGAPEFAFPSQNEATALDIVGKLVKYGSVSDKTMAYLRTLMDRIEKAPQIAAERAAEAAAAAPVPELKGRVMITGTVLSRKTTQGFYGPQSKMLIRVSDGGWKLWSTVPASIVEEVAAGDTVELQATIQKSDRDKSFAFASRPAKARIITKAKEAA